MSETPPPTTPPQAPKQGNFWSRRSRRGKILIVVLGLLVIFAAIGAFSDPPADDSQEASTTEATETQPATTEEAESPTTTEEEEEAEPPPPPPEKAPPPVVIKGTGAQVETINLSKDSPAIVSAVHRGSSNFAIELVGAEGSDLLVNEIGSFSGRVAVAGASAQRYRVKVTADGPWTITFTQPVPTPKATVVPAVLSGRGAEVVKFQAKEDLQPVVEGTHRGQSNFAVYVIGYGDASGEELVFNEIGNYTGETLIDSLPTGSYLLAVEADGPWTIRFSR